MKEKYVKFQKENKELFGLDHSTLKGSWKIFSFDIRYDYDGKSDVKPEKCLMFMLVFYKNIKIERFSGYDLQKLKETAELFVEELILKLTK